MNELQIVISLSGIKTNFLFKQIESILKVYQNLLLNSLRWPQKLLLQTEVTLTCTKSYQSIKCKYKTNLLTWPRQSRVVCAQTLYLPFCSKTFGMVSLGKGSSLRRVAMDDYDISWILLHKKKQRKKCLPDNQLDKAALERGHRVITS